MSNIKSLQRLLVVQSIYQLSINNDADTNPIRDIFTQIIENSEYKGSIAKSNLNFAESIFLGTQDNSEHIKRDLSNAISKKIKIHKIDPLLMAVFQPAIYELKYGPKISKKVVISEYLSIANKFFSEREIGLLNGVLDNIK
tara:strand:+ start:88 stop:510 length:423 start_codon:yes stop_codon:yes gene_type:complete